MADLLEEWLSMPAAYPAARLAIEALDPQTREELGRELETVDLHAGETLFAAGDPRDAAFLILRGRIELMEQSPQAGAQRWPRAKPRGGGRRDRPGRPRAPHQHRAGPRGRQGLAPGQDRL